MANNIPTIELIPKLLGNLRKNFNNGHTRPLAFRLKQLAGITRFLKEQERTIETALHQDLGKPSFEVFMTEIAYILKEIKITQKKLRSWVKPESVSTPLFAQPGKSLIYREPLGVVLIIGPWNYPLQLILIPLIGAIAAGNCAIIKPSEIAPTTSALLKRLLPQYLDGECIQIVEGGVAETTALLAEHFDYIFYTGNGTVGRIVMEAAAKHLTPVTLELGGKCPCIVDQNINLDVAARRILLGKFFNAGQTCVAPDYVLAHESIKDALLSSMKKTLHEFYGNNPKASPDFGRIVNKSHHQRLMKLLPGSGEIFVGGTGNEAERYIAPTILQNIHPDAPVMKEEIFGPILPVLTIQNIDEAIAFVNARVKPLALYLFSNNSDTQTQVLEHTSAGGVSVNYTALHVMVPSLPFGGVGASGIGAYHGKATFETFSHRKSVLIKPTSIDIKLIYPPYNKNKKKWIQRLL